MKYQALYDYVLASEFPYTVILIKGDEAYPHNIVIPTSGYAVPVSTYAQSAAGAHQPKAMEYERGWWDNNIEKALRDLSEEYMYIFRQPYKPTVDIGTDEDFSHLSWLTVGPAVIFASKEYAMGFVHGRNYGSVYAESPVIDLITGKTIKRKVDK